MNVRRFTNKIGLMAIGGVLTATLLVAANVGADSSTQGRVAVAQGQDAASSVQGPSAPAMMLNYQGRLLNPATGEPWPDDVYHIQFALYDDPSSDNSLWYAVQEVPLSNGVFSVLLGSVIPLDPGIFQGQSLWLGVAVEGDPEADPRQMIAYVPYAYHALNAEAVNGESASSFADASHTHSGSDINSGFLSTSRFSAYSDLTSENKIGIASTQVAPGYSTSLLKFAAWTENETINSTTAKFFTSNNLTVTPPASGYILVRASVRYNCKANIATQSLFGVYVTTSSSTPTSSTSFTYSNIIGFAFPLEGSSTYAGDFNPNAIVYPIAVQGGQTYRIWLGIKGANIGNSCTALDPRIIATFHLAGM